MGTSGADRMEKMRARKIAAGLRQVNVWVPADQVEAVRRFAAELVTRIDATTVQPQVISKPPPEHYAFVFCFPVKPSAEVRDRIKRMGCSYHADKQYWTAKVPHSDRDWAERYLRELGAEILMLEPIREG